METSAELAVELVVEFVFEADGDGVARSVVTALTAIRLAALTAIVATKIGRAHV